MRPLASLKRVYVGSMRGARRGLDRWGSGGGEAPPLDRRWRHWAYSLTLVHDSNAMAALDVPWWTYRASAAVDEWLAAREDPTRVFEYGSGASTVWLARRADEVHSVEHHRGFAELMHAELVDHPNASVRVVEALPSTSPVVGSQKEGHKGLDFADYVGAIDDVPGPFDLVVIDGRAREACLAAAAGRVAHDGLIVFDNSRRRRYREAITRSGLQEHVLRGLTPTLPYPEQTSLLTPR
jgi:predicted O-methyltransferase YrrM